MSRLFNLAILHTVLMTCLCGGVAAEDQRSAADYLGAFKAAEFSAFFGRTNGVFRDDSSPFLKSLPGYETGGTLETRFRYVRLLVFKSQDAAVAGAEAARHDCANVFNKGTKERSGERRWWFCESQASLWVVHGRMLFQVAVLDKRYSAVEDELWAAVTKFMKIAEPDGGANSHPAGARGSP